MVIRKDLTGKVFHKWTVVKRSGVAANSRHPLWLCRCECGNLRKVQSGNLINGLSKECRNCNNYGDIKGNVWRSIINAACKRGIEVVLTIKEADELFKRQNGFCTTIS